MKNYFKRYLGNNCSAKDFESFIELFVDEKKRPILDQQIARNWDETSLQGDTPDLNDTLHKIHFEINKQEEKKGQSVRWLTSLTRIAAVLLLPLAIAFFFQFQENRENKEIFQTISTPLASKTSFDLPDGSKVWLNSGSSISFPKTFDDDERIVKLKGEAYFDVKKGKRPFRVETEMFTVNVLGTAFNVMAYDHEIPAVTLERGKVSLKTISNNQQIMHPGQQAVIDTMHQVISLQDVDTDLFSSWINNQLILNNEPLGKVINRLERWYNIRIEVEDQSLFEKRMTANIEFESIREVMELMQLTLSVNYEYNKDLRKLKIFKATNN